MKTLYTSPVITVEELTKVDILCDSTERNDGTSGGSAATNQRDNINQQGFTLSNVTNLL